ncbi:hypothetical protein G1K66_12375 [Tenacibaculum finnmarkense]|uniref:hypothetical protein n=1 Tax=Tenacibaculum finnmarkense TaxID=2781243 RepID=UPI001E40C675|nr:hypothetical protein [Tenacibaculum finnmarkense]MCD8401302.1 hypothetical protein [Tenacibaculum finnmarkense genomovar ulcerans]MCG8786429.1 hypothetical protein [Tenacibaculum finnmarkense]MCG8814052.1 hypothetical protein [Tenacibaculum finnmarkense]
MKKFLLLILTIGTLISCSSNEDDNLQKKTSAKITLQNSNGEIKSGITIYAYDESTWETIGDKSQFADFQVASGNDGVATFTNLTTDLTFNELSNFTQTYRFSVHYNLNGTDKTKVKAITFNLGDDKSDTIILN